MTWYDYKDWMFVLVGQSHRVTAFRQNQISKWPDYFDCFKHPTLMAQANDFLDVSRLRYKVLKAQAWPNSGKAIPHDGGRHAAVAAVANGSNLDPAVAEVELNLHGAADHQDDACLHYFIGTPDADSPRAQSDFGLLRKVQAAERGHREDLRRSAGKDRVRFAHPLAEVLTYIPTRPKDDDDDTDDELPMRMILMTDDMA